MRRRWCRRRCRISNCLKEAPGGLAAKSWQGLKKKGRRAMSAEKKARRCRRRPQRGD